VVQLRPLRRWQAVVGLATAAALVLALVGAAITWFGPSQPVSAQAILDQAQQTAAQDAAPSGVITYHLTETQSHSVKLPGGTITTETWYAGSNHQRTDTQIKDATGAVVSSSGQISNGAETWIYSTENGQTRVIHATGTQWNTSSPDRVAGDFDANPSQGGSVADLIAQYNQSDKGCQTATQQGQATVAGRSVYVIILTPKQGQDSCGSRKATDAASQGRDATSQATDVASQAQVATARANKVMAATANAGQNVSRGQIELGQMTVWVDTQTFLPLKTETKATDGTVLDTYEVTSIQYNVQIPDSTFAYTPPANATVYTFNGTAPQDVKATIGAAEMKGTPPAKKP
jgi:outer membrane lipoprotein-sorting protein